MTRSKPTPARQRSLPRPLAVGAVVLACSAALAGPATRPAATLPSATRPARLIDMLPPDLPAERDDAPTDAEWAEISKFCKANAPNRWALFEKVRQQRGDAAPIVTRLKGRIAGRYRMLQDLANVHHPWSDRAFAQVRLEDAAWGAAVDARADPKNEKKAAQLRVAAKNLLESTLDARTDWLAALQNAVAGELDELEDERNHKEAMIDKQVDALVHDQPMDMGFRGFGWPRPRGWGQTGRGMGRRLGWEGSRSASTRPDDPASGPPSTSDNPPPQ